MARRQAAPRKPGPRERLRKELASLLDQVDDEGLVFLIRQAQTIIHNLQVDRLNEQITELNQERARALAGQRRKPGAKAARTVPAVEPVTIDEAAGGTSFVIGVGNTRKIFSRDEMRCLARVAQAAESDADGARRLYTWLLRNRTDVLLDMGVRSAASPELVLVHRAVRSRYRAKGPERGE